LHAKPCLKVSFWATLTQDIWRGRCVGILSQHSEVPRILEPSEHMLCLHHVFHNSEESNLLRPEWTLSFQSTESCFPTLKGRQPHKGQGGWGRVVWPICLLRSKSLGCGDTGLYFPRRYIPMRSWRCESLRKVEESRKESHHVSPWGSYLWKHEYALEKWRALQGWAGHNWRHLGITREGEMTLREEGKIYNVNVFLCLSLLGWRDLNHHPFPLVPWKSPRNIDSLLPGWQEWTSSVSRTLFSFLVDSALWGGHFSAHRGILSCPKLSLLLLGLHLSGFSYLFLLKILLPLPSNYFQYPPPFICLYVSVCLCLCLSLSLCVCVCVGSYSCPLQGSQPSGKFNLKPFTHTTLTYFTTVFCDRNSY
jgi:hypothetical protein